MCPHPASRTAGDCYEGNRGSGRKLAPAPAPSYSALDSAASSSLGIEIKRTVLVFISRDGTIWTGVDLAD